MVEYKYYYYKIQSDRYLVKKPKEITGIFKSHKLGYGFVKPISNSFDTEIFIPKSATAFAVEGDLVKVEILNKDAKGYDGKVLEILERKVTSIGGVVVSTVGKKAYLLCPLLGPSKEVEILIPKDMTFQPGDRLQVELLPGKSHENFAGKFKAYIGQITDASCDTDAAIIEFGLRREFPKRVLDEVKNLPKKIEPKTYSNREDLRKLVCFTIDPDTAKDYDDAVSLTKNNDGNYVLGVHIADVSYFVREGTALDQEALLRCNSTYFPNMCVSMLPKELADDLCSLKPNVPRLAVSTFMTLNDEGEVTSYEIKRSIIQSKERFTYEDVKLILDGKKKHKLTPEIKELEKAALILKQARRKRGCIDLALADSKIVLDKKGEPKYIKVIEYDITHQMIEEFMLKNNEVIAKHLSDKGISIPFRIHEEPKAENLSSFIQIAETMGFKLSKTPTQQEIQQIFEEVKGTHLEHQLSVHFIKCMKLAIYTPDNVGHYGLQLDYYSHFTSPIRRYVDLVLHRRVFGESKDTNIAEIADRCSDQERISAKAESSVRSLKMLRYFKSKDKSELYNGVVTKIKHFGIFFEIPELLYEGFIHVSNLGDDYYVFDEKKNRFKGERKKGTFQVGKNITAQVKLIDFITQEVHWVCKRKK